ncbi:MAG: peptidylprolyl isomerase [Sphingomonadaceae bacterium]|nr:peptidylprolyl isomerase [Sphingomonadaceae bacterium]
MRSRLVLAVLLGIAVTSAAPAKEKKSKPHKTPKAEKLVKAAQAQPQSDYVVPPQAPENLWDLDLSTGGKVVIQLRPDKAPKMVDRIRQLTCSGFYDGLAFHRVIDGFMAQGGDPLGNGEGGSTLPDVPAEFNDLPHVRGAVAAARAASEDSANSQFYIMFLPNLKLDKHYTVFGRVVSGMGYVDAIHRGEPPSDPSKVLHASIEGGCAGVQTVNARPNPLAPPPAGTPPPAADGDSAPGTGPVVPDPGSAPGG